MLPSALTILKFPNPGVIDEGRIFSDLEINSGHLAWCGKLYQVNLI